MLLLRNSHPMLTGIACSRVVGKALQGEWRMQDIPIVQCDQVRPIAPTQEARVAIAGTCREAQSCAELCKIGFQPQESTHRTRLIGKVSIHRIKVGPWPTLRRFARMYSCRSGTKAPVEKSKNSPQTVPSTASTLAQHRLADRTQELALACCHINQKPMTEPRVEYSTPSTKSARGQEVEALPIPRLDDQHRSEEYGAT